MITSLPLQDFSITRGPYFASPIDCWIKALSPKWNIHSISASKANIADFALECSRTGTYPHEYKDKSVEYIVTRTGLSFADAAVVKSTLIFSDFSSPIMSDFVGLNRAAQINRKSFIVPHLNSGDNSYEEITVATAGANKLINAELGVHSAVTIPQIVLITECLSTIKQFSLKGDQQVTNYDGLDVYVILTYINYFVLLFSLVSSVVQVWLTAYSQLSNYASAVYLSYPRAVRFSDVGTFVLSLAIIEPIRMAILLYGEGLNGSQSYFIAWVTIAAIFVIFLIVYNAIQIFATSRVYDMPPWLKIFGRPAKKEKMLNAIGENNKRKLHLKWRDAIVEEYAAQALEK